MPSDCCNNDQSNKNLKSLDHKNAIQERYGSAALEKRTVFADLLDLILFYLKQFLKKLLKGIMDVEILQNMYRRMILF